MRIWDLPPDILCRNHLLGEHRELHALWTILTSDKKGYRHHPETKRWVGKLAALYERHQQLVSEMEKRGYSHKSILSNNLASGSKIQHVLITSVPEQIELLRSKHCECSV